MSAANKRPRSGFHTYVSGMNVSESITLTVRDMSITIPKTHPIFSLSTVLKGTLTFGSHFVNANPYCVQLLIDYAECYDAAAAGDEDAQEIQQEMLSKIYSDEQWRIITSDPSEKHGLDLLFARMPREYEHLGQVGAILFEAVKHYAEIGFGRQNHTSEEEFVGYLLEEFELLRQLELNLQQRGDGRGIELLLGPATAFPDPNRWIQHQMLGLLVNYVAVTTSGSDQRLSKVPWLNYVNLDTAEISGENSNSRQGQKLPNRAFTGAHFKFVLFTRGGGSTKEITHLGASSFKLCSRLISIDLSRMWAIGARCFQRCSALKTVDLSVAEVTTIAPYCFDGCRSLTTVVFPPGLKRINQCAFRSCPLQNVQFDPLVYVHPSAFDNGVLLPQKPDYIPKVTIGERNLIAGTKFYSLVNSPTYDATYSPVLFFAENIQLCLNATNVHDTPGKQWWLHMFTAKRTLKLLTSPLNFREGMFRMWEDESKAGEEVEHVRVEQRLLKLCETYDVDGWYARLQLDNSSHALSRTMFETALLSQSRRGGFDDCLEQTAVTMVDRSIIKNATSAALSGQNEVVIKEGRAHVVRLVNLYESTSSSAAGFDDRAGSVGSDDSDNSGVRAGGDGRPTKKQKHLFEIFGTLRL